MVTKGNVLVVDDEINLCRILGAKLAKSGYSVVAVHDGLQAVEKVRESNFDVVLLDLILPKMDGLTALAEIRSMRSALPVIVMTACENAEALAQAKTYGVQGYVNKPFDLDNLVSMVADTSLADVSVRRGRLPAATVLFGKNQPVSLDIQSGSNSAIYSAKVYDKDDRTLSLALGQDDIEIPPHTTVRCGLSAVDAYYSFTTHVLKATRNPELVVILDKPGVIYRMQRRAYARRLMRIPAAYARSAQMLEKEAGKAETRDVSLGGVSLVVPEEMTPGDILHIELRPKTPKDKIKAVAHIMRSRRNDEGEGYLLGCRLTEADEALRKLLDR